MKIKIFFNFFAFFIVFNIYAKDYKVDFLFENLKDPWSMAIIDSKHALLNDLSGKMQLIDFEAGSIANISGIPDVSYAAQGGLSDIILDTDFESTNRIFFSYSAKDPKQKNKETLYVATGILNELALEEVDVIFIANSPRRVPQHMGAKLAFLPDETLLIANGDGFDHREKAQFLDNHFGKIIRINKDGTIPADNPFVNDEMALSDIYSYGHRNMQGLLVSDEGIIYEHEHGPRGGDELNIIEPGKNYGWPAITYGIDYSGAKISPFTEMDGMEQPLKYWSPSIAPSGMVLYTGDAFPAWKNSFLVSALVTKDVKRVYLDGNNYVEETLFSDIGLRIRNIHQTADGNLILLSDGPDGKIILVSPDND